MGDTPFLPLHLGFVGESVKQPMEIEGGGLAATPEHERSKKRPPSPTTIPDDNANDTSSGDDDGDWLVSGSEEDEDRENKVVTGRRGHNVGRRGHHVGRRGHHVGTYPPFTVDDIPRTTCDHDEQSKIIYENPDARLRGPLPIRLFPAFRSDEHVFGSDYNLGDKSEISGCNVGDCSIECLCWPMDLVQFIDVKIAGYRPSRPGCAKTKIFGFIAARETANPLRNYIYKREINNCETVSVKQETGVARLSLTSPMRVISMPSRALIEFELHALSEDEKGGDGDLIIEGCTELDSLHESNSFFEHRRLYSERCALDIKYAVIVNAVEARVSIEVLRVPSHGIDLKLYAKTSGFSEIIRLFQGAAFELGFTRSFNVAVQRKTSLDLYIKGSPRDDHALAQKPLQDSWECSFSPAFHGTEKSLAVLGDFAKISVKVIWKTYEKKYISIIP